MMGTLVPKLDYLISSPDRSKNKNNKKIYSWNTDTFLYKFINGGDLSNCLSEGSLNPWFITFAETEEKENTNAMDKYVTLQMRRLWCFWAVMPYLDIFGYFFCEQGLRPLLI